MRQLEISPDGNRIAITTSDAIHIYDSSFTLLASLPQNNESSLYFYRWFPDSKYVLISNQVYDSENLSVTNIPVEATSLWSPDGLLGINLGTDGYYVKQVQTNTVIYQLPSGFLPEGISWSYDSRFVAGVQNGQLRIFDTSTSSGQAEKVFGDVDKFVWNSHDLTFAAVKFLTEGDTIHSRLRIYDLENDETALERTITGFVRHVHLTQDIAVIILDKNRLEIRDLSNFNIITEAIMQDSVIGLSGVSRFGGRLFLYSPISSQSQIETDPLEDLVIVAIAPTLDRFAEIAAACGAPNTLTDIDTSLTDPTAIATQAQALLVVLDALPEGTIPPGCAADLGAIAEAIIAETPPISCDATIPAADVPALISAITAANGAGSPQTICLEEGTYALTGVQHNADGPNGLPAISGDVTLLGLGSGAVIQRDSSAPQFRILRVTSAGRLVLEKITIRGGDPGGSHNGGGIRNLGTLELKNSIVEENVARDGAGIRNNGTLIATESTIRNNTSPTSGAGLFSNTGSSTTLVETAVVANVASASSGLGGGIFMNGALLQITGGVLEANNARNGGGLFISTASTPVLLNGVQIVRNGASNAGGGLYIHSGQVELEAVTVAENIAIKLGGGIRNGDQLTMRASQLVENVGRDGGGGVFNGGTLVLEDSSLSGNSTDATLASGGGIMNQGVLSMNGGVVTENVARNGGGLFGNGGQAALTGVEIAQNEAQNNGGGIFDTSSATVVLSGVTLLNNSATNLGGGLASDGSFSITGSTLANNSAGAMGGGIFTGASQSNEVLQSCISGNSAPLTSGVRNNNAGVQLYATGSWWGAGDGPSGAGPGSGDAVSAGVDFSGYVADCATALSLAGAATAGLELQGWSGVTGELTLELAEAGLALGGGRGRRRYRAALCRHI